jgi:hypothetical protein
MQREDIIALASVDDLLRAAFVGDPTVFESYSVPESPTKIFTDPDELLSFVKNQREAGCVFFHFSIHFPETGGRVNTRRFALRSDKCAGATWRETTEGWGLIGIEVTDQSGITSKCSIAVNSEKRAHAWAGTKQDLGDPALWDWKAVERQARRLIRVLRNAARS